MKKLSFLLFVFLSLKLESKASWTKFSESWTESDKKELLSSSPLFRLEVKRYEIRKKDYFSIKVCFLNNVGIQTISQKKDLELNSNSIIETIQFREESIDKDIKTTLDKQENLLIINNEISLNHNFDIVTNMRLSLLKPIKSNAQLRAFSEYEVINPEQLQATPVIIMNDRSLLKQILNDHITQNPQLINSSKNKDIVVFLGNTGSGKSTLINYLNEKNLKVNDKNQIILEDSSDPSAMIIGNQTFSSETFLPRFIETKDKDIVFYDLPGFGDTRGTSINLANACFIKNIIEGASKVRLAFIAGYDEITASRGESFKKLLEVIINLLTKDKIKKNGCLIINKLSYSDKNSLIEELESAEDDFDILKNWIENGRITKMSVPSNKQINLEDRNDIRETIKSAEPTKISNINIQAIYRSDNLDHLTRIFSEEIQDNFIKLRDEIFKEHELSALTLEELVNIKKSFESHIFFKSLSEKLEQSAIITLLKPIADNIYTTAWNSRQRELTTELSNVENKIEEEIAKRNFLIEPKEFVKKLNRISDINDFLKKSKVDLGHKKIWVEEVLEEICNNNYSLIKRWLDNILSQDYNKLEEAHRTYIIPEVEGKNKDNSWFGVYYSKPTLHKLFFVKEEDNINGYNRIKFVKFMEKSTLVIHSLQFKSLRHSEEMKKKLESDMNYQNLFTQEKNLEQNLADCLLRYQEELSTAYSKAQESENYAYREWHNGYNNREKIQDSARYRSACDNADSKLKRATDNAWSIYNRKEKDIEKSRNALENNTESKLADIKKKIEQYENKTYPKEVIADSKEKQIEDIVEKIIKPNFNSDSFVEAIEFEDSESANSNMEEISDHTNLKRKNEKYDDSDNKRIKY